MKEGDSNLFCRDQWLIASFFFCFVQFGRDRLGLRSSFDCFVLLLLRFSVWLYVFRVIKRRRLMTGRVKKKVTGSHPGLAGWTGSRVDPSGRPGQFPSGFWPPPGPVPCPGRPGPWSTRRAGPGFKTMIQSVSPRMHFRVSFNVIFILVSFNMINWGV